MGSDADSGSGGVGSDPSSHPDYGGNYSGEPGGASGSENSFGRSNPASSANLGYSGNVGGWGTRGQDGSIAGFGSGGFSDVAELDWSGFIDGVKSFMSTVSLASTLGLNPAVAVPAYAAYKTFSYAWSNRNNPSVQPGPAAQSQPGDNGGLGISGGSPTYKSNMDKNNQAWLSYLADISTRTRARQYGQSTSFTSLLED